MNIYPTQVSCWFFTCFSLELTITIPHPNTSKKKNGVNYHISEALLNPLLIQDPTRSSISHFHPRNLHGHQWYHQQQNIKNYKGVMASSSFMFTLSFMKTLQMVKELLWWADKYIRSLSYFMKKESKPKICHCTYASEMALAQLTNFKLIKVSLSVYYCIQICFIIWYQQLRNSFTKCGYKRNSRA
jgi:hypothetical protein